MAEGKVKKSRKEREKELRDDGFKKSGGVNFEAISDRQVRSPTLQNYSPTPPLNIDN